MFTKYYAQYACMLILYRFHFFFYTYNMHVKPDLKAYIRIRLKEMIKIKLKNICS